MISDLVKNFPQLPTFLIMPRELITIQVGQCGNQIGCRFWDLALREHAAQNKGGLFDEAFSSFFRNVDTRYTDVPDIPLAGGTNPIGALRARAVLVDSEEGVVSQLCRGHLADLFDPAQVVSEVSGAGNNWAHGHAVYGPALREKFLECVRREAARCDSLQCFSLIHSLGGGTGSGLGTYLLSALEDECAGANPSSLSSLTTPSRPTLTASPPNPKPILFNPDTICLPTPHLCSPLGTQSNTVSQPQSSRQLTTMSSRRLTTPSWPPQS